MVSSDQKITHGAQKAVKSPIQSSSHSSITKGPVEIDVKFSENLNSIPKTDNFPKKQYRWNTNEEIASLLLSVNDHYNWLSHEVRLRPESGCVFLYNRKKVRYRQDGYLWKKRKDGKTTREDHMKLKVQGTESIYGCYVHSAILPTFHRRCYWLLQHPDIVLVHYLNVPSEDDEQMLLAFSMALHAEQKLWSEAELTEQLLPMLMMNEDADADNHAKWLINCMMEKQKQFHCEKKQDLSLEAINQHTHDIQKNVSNTFNSNSTVNHSQSDFPCVVNLMPVDSSTKLFIINSNPSFQHDEALLSSYMYNSNMLSSEKKSQCMKEKKISDILSNSSKKIFTGQSSFDCNDIIRNISTFESNHLINEEINMQVNPEENKNSTLMDLGIESSQSDEILFGVDSFDLFCDFPDFVCSVNDDHESLSSIDLNKLDNSFEKLIPIIDFAPEFVTPYSTGKLLIIGSWPSQGDYKISFGTQTVSAYLIHSGVLSCISPALQYGKIIIRVICNNIIISNEATLTCCFCNPIDEKVFLQNCLLSRLQNLEMLLHINYCKFESFEDKLIHYWHKIIQKLDSNNEYIFPNNPEGMTILHLAAALGYSKLISVLLNWLSKNSSKYISVEINCSAKDRTGWTPLVSITLLIKLCQPMHACFGGHLETSLLLYLWNPEVLNLTDAQGSTALSLAESNGHLNICLKIRQLSESKPTKELIYRPNYWILKQNLLNEKLTDSHVEEASSVLSRNSSTDGISFEKFYPSISSSQISSLNINESSITHPNCSSNLSPEPENCVFNLAEQIIAALPAKIKERQCTNNCNNNIIEEPSDLSWELRHFHDYSPDSCVSSPSSGYWTSCPFSIESSSLPPTTEDFTEFFHASDIQVEHDFSKLTLSDSEQLELYQAAMIIQKAYRSYRGRKKKKEEEDREQNAAIIIQNYYRRYKQYAYYKKLTKAALIIQNQYRNYCKLKRFRKPQSTSVCSNSTIKRIPSQKHQQAARKIQQFMKQSKNVWKGRLEEKLSSERPSVICRKRDASCWDLSQDWSSAKIFLTVPISKEIFEFI